MSENVPKPAGAKPKPAANPAAKPAEKSAADATKKGDPAQAKPTRRGKATGVREEMQEREEIGSFGIWLRESIRQAPSWLVSAVVHMIVLLILALTFITTQSDDFRQLVATPGDSEEIDEMEDLEDEIEELEEVVDVPEVQTDVVVTDPTIDEAPPAFNDVPDFTGFEPAPPVNLTAKRGAVSGNGLSGRGQRGRLALRGGGSPGSEKAVDAALRWLRAHQGADGGWSFDHTLAPYCGGKCPNPGSMKDARNGATALALLPFLGSGNTHLKGKYKSEIARGLMFLKNRMKLSAAGGSLNEGGGRMYSHGLAAITLCEAYGMTQDKALAAPAQQALNFICTAQHPTNGGWRYEPGQAGDTSVVGWQIMALKSGQMAYLNVPPVVTGRAKAYLDFVQTDSGSKYGYAGPGGGHATSAIGLLCRMYMGWDDNNPALLRGCEHISNHGPQISGQPGNMKADMYFNYYATQIMHHMGGDNWKKWNDKMRDSLVNSQAPAGSHMEGSWYFSGGHGPGPGGRLYCTAMACMILEVYYRHMPIYSKQSTADDFPE